MSELLWIAVPGGIIGSSEGRTAVLRVLIVPRLDGTTLASEGMADWPPQSLVDATLAVDFGEFVAGKFHTVDVRPPHLQAQPGVWQAFFGADTPVRPARHRTDLLPEVQVDNTSAQASAIKNTFEGAARTLFKDDPATRSEFHQAVRQQLKTHWSGENPPAPPAGAAPPPGRPVEPPDFHRTISLLREHPAVLRALGLIIELRIPAAQLPAGFSQGVLQVRWPGAPPPPALPEIVSPWTQYEFDGSHFLPASTTNISAGMVTLTDDRNRQDPTRADEPGWEVVTVDVDGGAQRLRDAAIAQAGLPVEGSPPAGNPALTGRDQPASLPALRTAGLMLVRRGRLADFATRRRIAEGNARRGSLSDAELTADDLVLGYRIDIRLHGGEWISLHQREATYFLGEQVIGARQVAEEGHVKAQAAVRQDDGTLRTDEVVARWNGWSLAVPQPDLDAHAGRSVPASRNSLPFDFHWEHKPKKKSLPRLKFASIYDMRARVADITGGGLSLDDPAADRCAIELIRYRRYEPVSSPDLVLPDGEASANLGPGEAIDLVVIRSDPGNDPGSTVAQFLSQNPRYTAHSRRLLLPPRVSLALAEKHPHVLKGDPEETFEQVKRAMSMPNQPSSPFTSGATLPDPHAAGVAAFPRRELGGINATMASREWEPWPDLKSKEVVLIEQQTGHAPVIWEDERLTVRLAPAEQVTLELSTFLRGDFLDHFAIKEVLPKVTEDTALLGRHPMLTPARVVNLVHAVRRPLSVPDGKLDPKSEPGQTFAILDPQPALLQVDPKSTSRLEISAAWSEFNDEKITEVAEAPVQTVPIDRGDRALKDTLRHEFGDTRHRKVTYTLTAVSRFRQFFVEDEDPEAFLARRTLPTVSIPSTARPLQPMVLSTLPAFRWEQENLDTGGFEGIILRRRRLSGLRLELQRPWFQSGAGEMLAVIVGKDNPPPAQLQSFLSQAGRDPIWDTPAPHHWLTPQAFASAAGLPAVLTLEEAGMQVVAVPHEAWFHQDRWYADIVLPGIAASSYCPFVQLAVARYQPESLRGLELSRVVLTEMIPLLPDRTLTVSTLQQTRIFVTLEGLGPAGPRPNRVDLIVEECVLPSGMPASAVDLAAVGVAPDGIPAWIPRVSVSGSLGRTFSIDLPPTATGPLRLRVREVELIGLDGESFASQAGTNAELSERTVFTDVITGIF